MQQDQPSTPDSHSTAYAPVRPTTTISYHHQPLPVNVLDVHYHPHVHAVADHPHVHEVANHPQLVRQPVAGRRRPASPSSPAEPPLAQFPATSCIHRMLQFQTVLRTVPAGDEHHWLKANRLLTNPEDGLGQLHFDYCHTCHAVLPVNHDQLPCDHFCWDWNGLPNNSLKFLCYVCRDSMPLNQLAAHVESNHPGTNGLENTWKKWYSYLCSPCGIVIYATWDVIISHRLKVHGGRGGYDFRDGVQQPNFDARIPWVSTAMRRVICEYNRFDGRAGTLYACVECDQWRTDSRNVVMTFGNYCNACRRSENKFYCPTCDLVLSCPRDLFEVHLRSFEHVYIRIHRREETREHQPLSWTSINFSNNL